MPRVLNRKTDQIPDGAVYVGRPSKYGNPFRVQDFESREACLEHYERWLGRQKPLLAVIRSELPGKDLACWCAPAPCHADILLRIANPETT